MSYLSEGAFVIRPLVRETASVRAINALKAADLRVDEGHAEELEKRPAGVIAQIRAIVGWVDAFDPTLEAEVAEPLDLAVAWGRARLPVARSRWWTLSVPFTLRLIRPATNQSFIIPTTEPDLDQPLAALVPFAAYVGAGAFRWDPRGRRWRSEDEGGAGVRSPLLPRGDLPLRTAEAEPPDE